MIVEKVIGTLKDTQKNVDYVTVEWFERDKRLLKKTSAGGEEIGLRISEPLNEGDILYEDDNKIIAVTIAPTELIAVEINDICQMGRLCFELGNRHLSLSIKPNVVKTPYDEPTYQYLLKLGFDAKRVIEKFTDYTVCHGHGDHTHGEHLHK